MGLQGFANIGGAFEHVPKVSVFPGIGILNFRDTTFQRLLDLTYENIYPGVQLRILGNQFIQTFKVRRRNETFLKIISKRVFNLYLRKNTLV